jgi:hypothetical protein
MKRLGTEMDLFLDAAADGLEGMATTPEIVVTSESNDEPA